MTSDEATIRDDVAESTHDQDPATASGGEARPVPGQRAAVSSSGGQEPASEATTGETRGKSVTSAVRGEDGEQAEEAEPAGEPDAEASTQRAEPDDEPTVHLAAAAPTPVSADPWSDAGTEVWQPPLGTGAPSQPAVVAASADEEEDWSQEYSDRDLFTAIVSAPALALAAFAFAVAGLLGGMIPESLPYLVQMDGQSGPVQHIKVVAFIALGFAIVSASLGFASLLRSIGSSLRWPRYLGGAAVLLALLIALQSALLIVLAALAPQDVPG